MLTPEERFEKFWIALQKSNEIWFDLVKVKFGKKDLRHEAQLLLMELHAEGMVTANMDWKVVQNRYSKKLTWAIDKVEPVPQQKAEPVVIHPQALTGEERQRWLKEWEKAHAQASQNFKTERSDPYKEIKEQRKQITGTYKPLTPEEVYKKDRHFEYVKRCFDPRTGLPNADHMPEEEFNKLYDLM